MNCSLSKEQPIKQTKCIILERHHEVVCRNATMAAPCTQFLLKNISLEIITPISLFYFIFFYSGLFLLPSTSADTWPPFLQQDGKFCPFCLVLFLFSVSLNYSIKLKYKPPANIFFILKADST